MADIQRKKQVRKCANYAFEPNLVNLNRNKQYFLVLLPIVSNFRLRTQTKNNTSILQKQNNKTVLGGQGFFFEK